MTSTYKAWLGIGAAVFLGVAACNGSNDSSTSHSSFAPPTSSAAATPAATAAPADPMSGYASDLGVGVAKQVRRVVTYRDVEFSDGTKTHVDVPDVTTESWRGCQEKILTAAAKHLLNGKTVTAGRQPGTTYSPPQDWVRLRGYEQYSPETDYTSALSLETTTKIMDQCYPATGSGSSSSSGSGFDVDVHRDHGLPDGALTGGYCRKKWWC